MTQDEIRDAYIRTHSAMYIHQGQTPEGATVLASGDFETLTDAEIAEFAQTLPAPQPAAPQPEPPTTPAAADPPPAREVTEKPTEERKAKIPRKKRGERERSIRVKVFDHEKETILAFANSHGLGMSAYMRRCSMRPRTSFPTAIENETLITLQRYRTNFARLFNLIAEKDPALVQEIKNIIALINTTINKFK